MEHGGPAHPPSARRDWIEPLGHGSLSVSRASRWQDACSGDERGGGRSQMSTAADKQRVSSTQNIIAAIQAVLFVVNVILS